MADNLDAFLEDILALPRWINRALVLLRELDIKSQECGEEAQRRRNRYLDLARSKLRTFDGQEISEGFYNDPELEAEAAAATSSGREAHALMKEKVVVLNQLIRVLRGETESFKLSLAKFAKEIGGEEVLRHSRRRPDGSDVQSVDPTDDAVQGVGSGAFLPAPRAAAVRSRVGAQPSVSTAFTPCEQNLSLLGTSEGPTGSDAVCSVQLGGGSTASSASRSRPSKKGAMRSTGIALVPSADGPRSAKRPRPPPGGGAPARVHQGKEDAQYDGVAEGFVGRAQSTGGDDPRVASPLHSGASCGASMVSSQGPACSRLKRVKQPVDGVHGSHIGGSHALAFALNGDQPDEGRLSKGSSGRLKKCNEQLSDIDAVTAQGAAAPPTDAALCETHVPGRECADGAAMQSAGLVIRLPPSAPLAQVSMPKTKSPAERSNKNTPRSLAGRAANPRVAPG